MREHYETAHHLPIDMDGVRQRDGLNETLRSDECLTAFIDLAGNEIPDDQTSSKKRQICRRVLVEQLRIQETHPAIIIAMLRVNQNGPIIEPR